MKTLCDSVNHTRFPKEDHLRDWARRVNKVMKGDRVPLLVHKVTARLYRFTARNVNHIKKNFKS